MASTAIQSRVQVRKSRKHAWRNKGLFETRERARMAATILRGWDVDGKYWKGESADGYGFGNTRVVRYERRGK